MSGQTKDATLATLRQRLREDWDVPLYVAQRDAEGNEVTIDLGHDIGLFFLDADMAETLAIDLLNAARGQREPQAVPRNREVLCPHCNEPIDEAHSE